MPNTRVSRARGAKFFADRSIMGQSLCQNFIHLIFSTKQRKHYVA